MATTALGIDSQPHCNHDLPFEVFPRARDPVTPVLESRLVWTLVAVGVLARAVRYALCFPLWEDEAFLCANFIGRGYADLLQPLTYHQVAPLLFLWIELTLVKWLGYSELVLRLFPFACGIGSVFLFKHVAERLLRGSALVLAVAVFACCYPGIRYAAEAKQYGSDLMVSLALIALTVEGWRDPARTRWIWALAGVMPLALGLSFPAVFVAGGVSLALLVALARSRLRTHASAWIVLNVAIVVSFAGWFALTRVTQSTAGVGWMQEYWGRAFPPLSEPAKLPVWLLATHTGNLLAYPLGSERGGSSITFIWCVAAVVCLIRQRRTTMLALLLVPAALHFTAAALHRYPYGEHVKFSHYLAPIICLLAGIGSASLLGWLTRERRSATRMLAPTIAVVSLVALGTIARDVVCPWKTKTTMRARSFASWFWYNTQFEGEVVCLQTDLHENFAPQGFSELSWSALYVCNQAIYSPRHQRGAPVDWDRVTRERPVRCVNFRPGGFEFDNQQFTHWLSEMQTRYDLVGRESFPFPCYGKSEKDLRAVDYVDIYQFVPKSDNVAARPK